MMNVLHPPFSLDALPPRQFQMTPWMPLEILLLPSVGCSPSPPLLLSLVQVSLAGLCCPAERSSITFVVGQYCIRLSQVLQLLDMGAHTYLRHMIELRYITLNCRSCWEKPASCSVNIKLGNCEICKYGVAERKLICANIIVQKWPL